MDEEVLAPEKELEIESPDESTEVEEAEVEEEAPAEEEEVPEEEPKPSRRESLRIQALISKMKQDSPVQAPKDNNGLNYEKALNADEETIKELEADRKTYGQTQYNAGLEQAKAIEFRTLLEIDAPKVESKYGVLDKESADFNPVVANAINSWYLSSVGYNAETGRVANSNVRYSEFVEGIMELADEMAGQKVATTTKNIVKQAANLGIRPGGTTVKLDLNKDASQMSDKELDAKLAALNLTPKKR
jgi:hypothetical protein